jgi:26S proteasome regulatory subunit N8
MCVSALPSTRKKDTSKPHETYCEVTCLRVKQLSTGMDLQDGTPTRRSFVHLESEIGAEEAEEIGVEHLLRDIKDTTVSTLAERVSAKLVSLKGLQARLEDIHAYLKQVQEGKMPVNHEITFLMQEIFNLLPNLNVEELVRSFSVKTNDMMLVIYISSLIRSVIALHNLINNKINLKDAENDEGKDKDKTVSLDELVLLAYAIGYLQLIR